MKFGHLIKYNMKNIFLEKSCTKRAREGSLRPSSKKSKLSIYLMLKQSEMLLHLFLLYIQVEVYKNILKLRCWSLIFTLYKAFSKNKKGSETSLSSSFSTWFLKKNISHIIFYWVNSIAWLPFLLEMFGNMCIVIICFPVCNVINFEINLNLFIKLFFYLTKKSRQKCNYLKNEKSF